MRRRWPFLRSNNSIPAFTAMIGEPGANFPSNSYAPGPAKQSKYDSSECRDAKISAQLGKYFSRIVCFIRETRFRWGKSGPPRPSDDGKSFISTFAYSSPIVKQALTSSSRVILSSSLLTYRVPSGIHISSAGSPAGQFAQEKRKAASGGFFRLGA